MTTNKPDAHNRVTMPLYAAPQSAEQQECGCCGQTVKCDDDCDAVIFRKADRQPQQDVSELVKAAQKFDRDYARRKLELVLRDLRDYTADEFWRDISRIASGATGLLSAEHLKSRVNELEAELATARAGWQETIAKMASHERPAYDEQQQRIAKLEVINLGLTKTLVELHAEQAKLVEALESLLEVQDEDCRYDHQGYCQNHNLDHVDDGCRVARAKTALAAYRKLGGGS